MYEIYAVSWENSQCVIIERNGKYYPFYGDSVGRLITRLLDGTDNLSNYISVHQL